MPPSAAAREKELAGGCGKDGARRALLLLQVRWQPGVRPCGLGCCVQACGLPAAANAGHPSAPEHSLPPLPLQMARRQGDPGRREAQLQEACELLSAAQAQEEQLLLGGGRRAAQQPSARRAVPPAPQVLERTPTSVTLVQPAGLQLRGGRQPASYAVYCKSYGAGVALSINSTSMEYPGGCAGRRGLRRWLAAPPAPASGEAHNAASGR